MPTLIIFAALSPFKISYLITQEYAELNFIYQTLYLLVAIIGVRFKYYSAWSLGMIGMNASGITYNPIKN